MKMGGETGQGRSKTQKNFKCYVQDRENPVQQDDKAGREGKDKYLLHQKP